MNPNARTNRCRAGWTRIEVLVVIMALVLAAGFIIVVLHWGRDQANIVECEMHLKRMGDAMREFEGKHKTLPASCIAPGYATWAVQIAPYLQQEHGKELRAWDEGLPYYQQTEEVRKCQVWVYYCPARRYPPQYSTSGDVPPSKEAGPNFTGATGDYGCAPASAGGTMLWMTPQADGALIIGEVLKMQDERIVSWKARTTIASLKRGQQYTILLGEKHVVLDTFGQAGQGDGSLYNGEVPASFARLIDADRPLATGPTDPYRINFGSWHPNRCQFLLADTSVRQFTVNTPPDVVQRLIPRDLPE